jgi:cell division initiation protein
MKKDHVVGEVLGEELAITPSDLYNHAFKNVLFGGYDKNEVDALLERVADVLESLIKQSRDLKQQREDLRSQLDSYREMENSLREALVTAQKFSEEAVGAARREASALLEQARLAKARAELEAGDLPRALVEEIHTLKCERGQLRNALKAILDAHYALVRDIPPAEETIGTASFVTQRATEIETEPEADGGDESTKDTNDGEPLTIEREPWLESKRPPATRG